MPRHPVQAVLCLTLAASALVLGGCEDKEAIARAQKAETRVAELEKKVKEKAEEAAALAAKCDVFTKDVTELTTRSEEASKRSAEAETAAKEAVAKIDVALRDATDANSRAVALSAKIAELNADAARTPDERYDRMKKELKEVSAHRDELMEWVEKELLPIAEAQDPRLANLKSATEEMQAEVAKVRKLAWKRPVMRRLVTRDQVGEWMRRDLKKDMPEEEAQKIVATGAEMGLLKPGTDLYVMFSQFMEAGAAAFYKPDTKTFYHIEGNDGRGAYPVVFHELVHAIEDQHYSLDQLSKIERDSDRSLAIKGLVEGTASYYGEVYEKAHPEDRKAMMKAQMTPEMIKKQMAMMKAVPTFFIAMMALYPYNNGKEWVAGMGAEDPAAADALFRDPPVSTEQILHPAKWKDASARDWPHAVAKPALTGILGSGWTELEDDTMGELMTGVLLATLKFDGKPGPTLQAVASASGGVQLKPPVKKAAEGWDGDRYAAWISDDGKGGKQCCMVWSTVWDSDQDAQEFADVYAPLLAKKVTGTAPDANVAPPELNRVVEPASGRVSLLEVRGSRVVAVLGAPADKADACLKAGFDAPVTADARDANDKN